MSEEAERELLDMHRDWLARLETKVDAALAATANMSALHADIAPHNHTSLNCPLAERAEQIENRVKEIESNVDKVEGGLSLLRIIAGILTVGIAILSVLIGILQLGKLPE